MAGGEGDGIDHAGERGDDRAGGIARIGEAGRGRGAARLDRHQLRQSVLPLLQRGLLRAQVRFGGGGGGAARVQLALRHAAGTDQVLGAPQRCRGGGELRLCLCHGGLSAGDIAAGGAEFEIIEHGQALPGLHLLADDGIDGLDSAACGRHDARQAQRIIGDDAGGRHVADQRAQRRIGVVQLHVRQGAGRDGESRRQRWGGIRVGGLVGGRTSRGIGAVAGVKADQGGGDQRAAGEQQLALGHSFAPRPIEAVANAPFAGFMADLWKKRMGKLRRVDM